MPADDPQDARVRRREQIALHEAGHWVIGELLGFAQGLVSIQPDERRGALG